MQRYLSLTAAQVLTPAKTTSGSLGCITQQLQQSRRQRQNALANCRSMMRCPLDMDVVAVSDVPIIALADGRLIGIVRTVAKFPLSVRNVEIEIAPIHERMIRRER